MIKLFKQKLFQLVLLMGLAIVMFSCYPVCQDCVTYTNQTTFEATTICYDVECEFNN